MDKQSVDWAILVYISADRVLTNFAIESLKQLKRATANASGKKIVALVQMQGTGERNAHRFQFHGIGRPDSSLARNHVIPIKPPVSPGGIADPENLKEFIKWAVQECDAKHRCLFLWGHGYELLLNSDSPVKPERGPKGHAGRKDQGPIGRNYLAPRSLKVALEGAKPFSGEFDIIGIDACAMCLVELASELADCGKVLIASQEDVPDASFPYERLLLQLKDHDSDNVEEICEAIPGIYTQAYQDYVDMPGTGMREVTLASVRLKNITNVTDPLIELSAELLACADNKTLRRKILTARQAARDFALGLFVDLRDFCAKVSARVEKSRLKSACDAVVHAIDTEKELFCMVASKTRNGTKSLCHGLSIYLPYLKQEEMDQTRRLLPTATTLVDQIPLLLKGGPDHILKARSVQINQIEGDFESLQQFKKTGWSAFIKDGWSRILAFEEPWQLDERYSGEQCAVNLLSPRRPPGKPSGEPPPPPPLRMAAKA